MRLEMRHGCQADILYNAIAIFATATLQATTTSIDYPSAAFLWILIISHHVSLGDRYTIRYPNHHWSDDRNELSHII